MKKLRVLNKKSNKNKQLVLYKIPKNLVKPTEPKIKDFMSTSSLSFFGSGVIVHLSDISQGTAFNERVGLQVNIKSLTLIGDLYRASGMTFARIMFLIDRQQTAGFPPNVTDVLSPPVSTFTTLNWFNRKRFRILSDTTYGMNAVKENISVNKKIVLPNIATLYASTSGTPQSNGVYMLVISNLPLTPAYMDYSIRVKYTDS